MGGRGGDGRGKAEKGGGMTSIGYYERSAREWALFCFGKDLVSDKVERVFRFLEEALELAQALGCTEDDAKRLAAYVFGRPVGDPAQEVGGVMLTLATLCTASGIDLENAAVTELGRVWQKVDTIRAKQATKPHASPLPGTGAAA